MGLGGPTLRGFDAANLEKISAALRLLHRLFDVARTDPHSVALDGCFIAVLAPLRTPYSLCYTACRITVTDNKEQAQQRERYARRH